MSITVSIQLLKRHDDTLYTMSCGSMHVSAVTVTSGQVSGALSGVPAVQNIENEELYAHLILVLYKLLLRTRELESPAKPFIGSWPTSK